MKCEVNSPSILLDNEDSGSRLHKAYFKPVISGVFLSERAKQAGGFLNNSPLLTPMEYP
jgi:hypothetical protein